MFYVYILQDCVSKKYYRGFTKDLRQRLSQHQRKHRGYTSQSKEWKLVFYCAFLEKQTALHFEKYLKSGSGIAFIKKRLSMPG